MALTRATDKIIANADGNLNLSGIVTASSFSGSGANLSGINTAFGNSSVNTSGIITASSFFGDGSNLTNLPAGLGTALSSTQTSPLNKIYFTDRVLSIGSTVTVDHPATATGAYTQYSEITIEDDADLIIADGDDLIPDILGLGDTTTTGAGGSGRLRIDTITNKTANGAPTATNGLEVTGICTATDFSGQSGGAADFPNGLTGTTATFSGNLNVAGVLTYEDVKNVDSIGVGTFRDGIKVGSGVTIEPNGQATFTGIVTFGTNSTTIGDNVINVGTALTLGHTQGLQFHTQNLHSRGFEVNQINATGVITATSFVGDGSALTGLAADKIFEGNTEVEVVDTGTDGSVKFTLEGSEKARIVGVGSFGLGVSAPVCSFDASSKSDALQVPNGTTAERPSGISAANSYGMIRYNETFGLLEKYDASGWSVIDNPPVVSSFSGVLNQNVNSTLTINGSGFKSGAVVSIEGAAVSNTSRALTTTFVGVTTLTVPTNAASVNYVDNASFNIKVVNPGGLSGILENAGTVDSTLTWSTGAGSLGTWFDGSVSNSVTVTASDPDGTSVTYAVTSGSLPPNTTLNASSGVISTSGVGNLSGATTYSFTITATSNTISVARAFTITGTPAPDGSSASRATTPDYLRNTIGTTTDGYYWIKTTGMSSAVQCYINFGMLDSKDWILMAHWNQTSSTGGTQQNINNQSEKDHLGKNIPFKGFAYDDDNSYTYSYFSSYDPYNQRYVGENNGGTTSSGGNKSGFRLYIGSAGGMGWYGTQTNNRCNWQNSSGMVGAGFDGSCGVYPGSLRFGTGTGSPYMGSNHTGQIKMWIWMDNKQPIA